ncbi:MAG: hypothetical protein ABWX94_01410 [Candidatus Saccharimonadales bacterium]
MVTLFSVIAPLIPQTAFAAGSETYKWNGGTTTYSIQALGDAFGGGIQFLAQKPTLPSATIQFKLTGTIQFNKNGVNCKLTGASDPNFTLTITVRPESPNTGVITWPPDTGRYGTGGVPGEFCTSGSTTWGAVRNYFNNVTINISGTPPFDAGGAAGQVSVTAIPGQARESLPPSATFSIKAGKDHTLLESLALPSIASATAPYNGTPAGGALGYGTAVFTLPPGEYSACAEWVVGRACAGFIKGAAPSIIQLKDLQTPVTSRVEIRMCFGADSATGYTLGPYKIGLKTNDDKLMLMTGATDSRSVKPVEGSGNADSRICIPAFIDDLNSGTGLVGTLSTTNPEINKQINLNPGGYKVCIITLNQCKPYAPNVVFILSDVDGAVLMSESQKKQGPPKTSCELSFGDNRTASYFVCPITEAVNLAVSVLDTLININLQPDLTIFDKTGNGSAYRAAWNSFRVIAIGFIVITALIMIIAQASGLEIFAAYTVRKVLPRLLFAAIFVTLSWDVLEILFRLSDAAVLGIRSLIYAPFSSLDPIQLGGGTAFASVLLAGGAIVAMGWASLLSLGLSALLSVAMAFFILILIKIALTAVLITSPLLIAASILPGTSKLYEFGKTALITLLLAPVVVGAIIALFRVAAVVAYNRADGNAAINQIIAILLYFGAYFAILKGLSAMGGVAATLTGAVSNGGQGVLNGLKKQRANTRKERRGKMASGSLYKGNNILARSINWGTQTGTNVGKGAGIGILPGSRRKHAAMNDLGSRAAAERAMKSEDMQMLQYDDDGIAAMFLSGGKSSRRARSELRRLHSSTNAQGQVQWHDGWNEARVNKAVNTAEAVGINKENAMAAGTLGAQNKFRSLGGGQDGIDAIDATANYMSGGSQQLRDNIRDGVKYHARVSGRSDLAANHMDESWGRTSIDELTKSSPTAMKAHLQHISNRARTGGRAQLQAQWQDAQGNWRRDENGQLYTQQRLDQEVGRRRHVAAVQLVEAHNVMNRGTSGETQQVINQELTALGFDFNTRRTTSVEDWAADIAGVGPRGSGAGQAVKSQARTQDPAYFPVPRQVTVIGPPAPAPTVPIKPGTAARTGVNGRRPPAGP